MATTTGRWSGMFGGARWDQPLKIRAGGRYGAKSIDKGVLFQTGDSSTQQLCQEDKMKRNNCVRACVRVFYPRIQGKLGGGW